MNAVTRAVQSSHVHIEDEYEETLTMDHLTQPREELLQEFDLIDAKKNYTKMYAGMHDISICGPLPHATNIPCWNCRRNFSTPPLGIPINFIKFHHLSKDKEMWAMYLKDNNYVGSCCSHENQIQNIDGYFETEGVVCSWECMKNYILENSKSSLYKDSINLMHLLHGMLTGGKELNCNRGASWRVLKEWGGHIDSKNYNDSVKMSKFFDTVNVRRPLMFSLSRYYERAG
jgi:hypothetical protein